jgi:cytidyltransferase-like protein
LNTKKVVLAGGVFDIIHPGHIHTLNAAKALGSVLVVAIATDKTAKKMKKRLPLHNQELRRELVSCLSMVDKAVVGHEDDIFETVKNVKPDIIVLGYDQVHQEKFISDGCKRINLNIEIVRLETPVPHLSSSEIEKEYGTDIHGL